MGGRQGLLRDKVLLREIRATMRPIKFHAGLGHVNFHVLKRSIGLMYVKGIWDFVITFLLW